MTETMEIEVVSSHAAQSSAASTAPGSVSAPVPVKLEKDKMASHIKDALFAYYSAANTALGPHAAKVVAWLARYVEAYKPKLVEVSELVRSAFESEPTEARLYLRNGKPVMTTKVKGDPKVPFAKAVSHPYKQDGLRWRRLATIQAGIKTDRDRPVSEWPSKVTILGREYATPVDALSDGHGLARVYNVFIQAIGPLTREVTKTASVTDPQARMDAAYTAGSKARIQLRRGNEAKTVRIAKTGKSIFLEDVAFGYVIGVLFSVSHGGLPQFTPEHRAELIAFIEGKQLPVLVSSAGVEDSDGPEANEESE